MKQHGCSGASLRIAHIERAHIRFSKLEDIDHIIPFIASRFSDPAALYQGLSELMINAIEHGNLGISYAEKTQLLHEGTWQHEINRRLALPENQSKYAILDYAQQPNAHILTIRDQGTGFDWQPYMQFSPARAGDPNGRGIAIANALDVWNIEYQDSGRRVVCRVRA